MKIAIDINDVLRDYTRQFANMYKKIVDNSFDLPYEEINDFFRAKFEYEYGKRID